MDEDMLFKFGKLVEYGRGSPQGWKIFPKRAWSGSRDLSKIL